MMSRNLTELQRNVIVILRNNGKSWTEIAREMREKYSKTVTKRGMQYLWKKYLKTGSVWDKMRKGRPTIVSPQASRAITRICKANRLLSVHNITHTYNTSAVQNVSFSTVQKILKCMAFEVIQHIWNCINVSEDFPGPRLTVLGVQINGEMWYSATSASFSHIRH